jgi:hypothetical protein
VASAAVFLSAPAAADVPGIGPLVGQWVAHGETLTINADGTAVEPARLGMVNIRFRTADGNSAAGIVTRSTISNVPAGGQAGANLVDGGRGLLLTINGGDSSFPFCKIVNGSKANSADCGA